MTATHAPVPVRRIITVAALQAGLSADELLARRLSAGPVMAARDRAAMLARHLRPDRSWSALGREFRRDRGGLIRCAGRAVARYVAQDAEEVAAVHEIGAMLEGEVGEISMVSSQVNFLRNELARARRRVAYLERELMTLEGGAS